jgi:hypothetical protein
MTKIGSRVTLYGIAATEFAVGQENGVGKRGQYHQNKQAAE